MKSIALALAAIMLFPLVTQGDEKADTRTLGKFNGRFWRNLSEEGKTLYVIGFNEGSFRVSLLKSPSLPEFQELHAKVWPQNMTFGEVRDSVDNFYKIPENGRVTVIDALSVVAEKAKGVDAARIEERTEQLRRFSQQEVTDGNTAK